MKPDAPGGRGSGRGNDWYGGLKLSLGKCSTCLGPTCTAALQELEQDIKAHGGGQRAPAAAVGQLVH